MAPNSLFAVLLRSPWWISFGITAGFVVIAYALLPADYALAGALGSAPFFVIGCIAAWRQLRAPSAKRVASTLEGIRAMTWNAFSEALQQAFRRDGYEVARHVGPAADLKITKNGRVSLVSCKRWKAARTGVEPLRELTAARDAADAHDCIYVVAGDLTEQAVSFAAGNRVRVLQGVELAMLLPGVTPPLQRATRVARG